MCLLNRLNILSFAGLMLVAGSLPICAVATETLPTVSQIDMTRYQGQWYEISRLPMWFERRCLGDVTATYTPQMDGRMDVLNRCRTQNDFISARGIAEMSDPNHPGQLRVRFAPDWMAWLDVVWGDYWIINLDPEYQWVLVGAPSRNYLWILARTPTLDQTMVQKLKEQANHLGFNTAEMIDVSNVPDRQPEARAKTH